MPRRAVNNKNAEKYKKIIKKRKVFGIGLSKTGTSSLATALGVLGYHCKDYSIGTADGKVLMEELKKPTSSTNYKPSILDENYDGDKELPCYDAMTDIAVSCWFEQYDLAFDNAKFILTVRDMDDWLDSTERWWATNDDRKERLTLNNGFIKTTTYGVWEWHKERMKYVYQRHKREVLRWFKKRYSKDWEQHLLVMNIINGCDEYKTLCKFLEFPNEAIPTKLFPHVNINRGVLTKNKKLENGYSKEKKEYIKKYDKSGKFQVVGDRVRRVKDGKVKKPNIKVESKSNKTMDTIVSISKKQSIKDIKL